GGWFSLRRGTAGMDRRIFWSCRFGLLKGIGAGIVCAGRLPLISRLRRQLPPRGKPLEGTGSLSSVQSRKICRQSETALGGGCACRETSPHQSPAATASPQGEAVGGNRKPFLCAEQKDLSAV